MEALVIVIVPKSSSSNSNVGPPVMSKCLFVFVNFILIPCTNYTCKSTYFHFVGAFNVYMQSKSLCVKLPLSEAEHKVKVEFVWSHPLKVPFIAHCLMQDIFLHRGGLMQLLLQHFLLTATPEFQT